VSLIVATAVCANDSRAEEVFKQAREAMGGERLQKIEALYITGQYCRAFGDRQMAGDRENSISLPDNYLIEDSMNPCGMSTSIVNTRGLNGERAWSGSNCQTRLSGSLRQQHAYDTAAEPHSD